MSAAILLGFQRQWYSYSAFPQSQFLLQPRKGFGLVDFQGSWVNYSCTCLGKLSYKQNRELGMIILVWKKMLVISMHSRCWRQDYLCPQFWRIWYTIWYMKSHVLFFSFSLTCGKAAPLLVWWWGKYSPAEEAVGKADAELRIFKGCQMFGREWGTHLQVFFIQLP